jgi:hypothetical protein
MFKTLPAFEEIEPHKFLYNVGALLDIPTGTYVKGIHGESILNGGYANLCGIAGKGNSFKSMISHYMNLTVAEHIAAAGYHPYVSTYDTEVNIVRDRLQSFLESFPLLKNMDALNTSVWSVTDKSKHYGDEWYSLLKTFLNGDKLKNKKDYMVVTPMVNNKGVLVKTLFPTFGSIDSMTEFETADVIETQRKNELGESGGNMIFARSGLAKTRLMGELPVLCAQTAHFMTVTAQVGPETTIGQPTHGAPPPKRLQHMRPGEKIKGITDKFFFLTGYFLYVMKSDLLNDKDTKGPIYPKLRAEDGEPSEDLNVVTVKQLRSKFGPSGYTIDFVISQSDGVLPTLTEFYYLKNQDKFGMGGNNINFHMQLLPEVNLMRTTLREKIDTTPALQRAIKITADLLQIKHYHTKLDVYIPTPLELYEKLKTKYDWKVLLDTRDWWTFNNDEVKPNFLSTMDLVNMYNDTYVPFWLEKTK